MRIAGDPDDDADADADRPFYTDSESLSLCGFVFVCVCARVRTHVPTRRVQCFDTRFSFPCECVRARACHSYADSCWIGLRTSEATCYRCTSIENGAETPSGALTHVEGTVGTPRLESQK